MKKNCNIVKDLLPLYLDNVCSKESKELIIEHLKECDDCKNYLEELKFNVKSSKNKDVKLFKKIIKKINFKIIRNTIIIICLLLAIYIPVKYYYNNYKFPLEYNKDALILLHKDLYNEKSKKWNFQFSMPKMANVHGISKEIYENGEKVNIIFLTAMSTPNDYLHNVGGGTAPDMDYESINPNEKMKVYYTTEDLEEIKNASNNELEHYLKNATLIFTNDEEESEIICNLNNNEYKFNLTYYKGNGQITNIENDDTLPQDLLCNSASIYKGDYKTIICGIYPIKKDVFEKVNNYMTSLGGSCTEKVIND